MALTNHEELYKFKGRDIGDIKQTTKAITKLDQSRFRERLFLSKRLKVESLEAAETKLSEEEKTEQVERAVKLLKHGTRLEALTTLHRCFAQDSMYAESFMRSDGLQPLQSCFKSSDPEILHASAWCVINLSAGDSSLVQNVMRFTPILIQFLQGSDTVMQELCAWAIGNLAGDSHTSRNVLLHQGCIPHLLNLISSKHHLTLEARSQCVLLALINLARDKNYNYIRSMQENSVFPLLVTMLKTIPATSELYCEVGWLASCLYSRQETFQEYRDQYDVILPMMIDKLWHISNLRKDHTDRDKVLFPYLLFVGNCVGFSPDLAIRASESQNFLPSIIFCLAGTGGTEVVFKQTLWLLTNFLAEPSCRVFALFHTEFLTGILKLCQSSDVDVAVNALCLVDAMTKVSSYINSYLVHQGVMGALTKLLDSPNQAVVQQAIDIITDLSSRTLEGKTLLQDSVSSSQIQQLLVLHNGNDKLKEKLQCLSHLL